MPSEAMTLEIIGIPAIILIIGISATIIIAKAIHNLLTRHTHQKILSEPRLRTTFTYIERVVYSLIIIFGVAFTIFTAFPEIRIVINSFFVAAGVASVIIGLAAQSTFSNIISGALIAIVQPFRIGDEVMFRNEYCTVEDIKLIYTTLTTWDNRHLMIPNSIFQTEVVTNYTMVDETMLIPISVQIGHQSDIDMARQIMEDIAKNHPNFLYLSGLPSVKVMDLTSLGITLRLLTRASNQSIAFDMSKDILLLIKKEFDAHHIEFSSQRIYVVGDKNI